MRPIGPILARLPVPDRARRQVASTGGSGGGASRSANSLDRDHARKERQGAAGVYLGDNRPAGDETELGSDPRCAGTPAFVWESHQLPRSSCHIDRRPGTGREVMSLIPFATASGLYPSVTPTSKATALSS